MLTSRKRARCLLQLRILSSVLSLVLRLGAIGILAESIGATPAYAQAPSGDGALTLQQVVKLSQEGFSEELIITRIKKNGKAFDLNTDELLDLKKQGLSENVIRFLLDPTLPYTPPPPAPTTAAAPPGKKYPPDPFASLVPAERGLYFFVGKTPSFVDLKVLLGMRKGRLLKGKPTAYVPGASAKLRVKTARPVFYLRLPDGKEVSDIILISLTEKDDRRELNGLPGAKGGGLNAGDVLQFDQLEVGARLFRLTPPQLGAGEYLFFLVGSAEPDKGTYGKGYDFGVDPEPSKKNK